jgi:hypothetical protein
LSSAARDRLIGAAAWGAAALFAAAAAFAAWSFAELGAVDRGLPVAKVGQYGAMTGMLPLFPELASELELARGEAQATAASELRFTLSKIGNSRKLVEAAFARNMPPELSALSSEIASLAADLGKDLDSGAALGATKVILYENRAGYISSEFRDYVLRSNNEALLALERQEARLGRMRASMLASAAIEACAAALALLFIRYRKGTHFIKGGPHGRKERSEREIQSQGAVTR